MEKNCCKTSKECCSGDLGNEQKLMTDYGDNFFNSNKIGFNPLSDYISKKEKVMNTAMSSKKKYSYSNRNKEIETYIDCTKEWTSRLDYIISLYEEKIENLKNEYEQAMEQGFGEAYLEIDNLKNELSKTRSRLEKEFNQALEEAYTIVKAEVDEKDKEIKNLTKEVESLKAQLNNPDHIMGPTFRLDESDLI